MKKILLTMVAALTAVTFTNCQKDEAFTPEQVGTPFEIVASPETRTVNDGMSTKWADGDAVNVFHAVEGSTDNYINDGEFTLADVTTGTFTGTLTGDALTEDSSYDWYMFYPYSSYIKTPANTGSGYMPVGSKTGATQTQTGINSMAHIAGENYPMAGKVEGVMGGEKPSITMKHVSALVRVNVTNNNAEAINVTSIKLTAPEDIIGTYYINFAGETPEFTGSGTSYVSSTATLTVTDGTIEAGETAAFYLAIKPIELNNQAITVAIDTEGNATFEKEFTALTTNFSAGKIKTINVAHEAAAAEVFTIPFEDNFSWLSEHTDSESAEMAIDLFPEYYSEVLKLYDTNDYLKVGTGSVRGYFKTAQFDLSQDFVVVVKAMTYGTDASTISVTVDDETATAQTLTGAFKYYEFPFTAKSTSSKVTVNINGKRGYISYFAILKEFTLPPVINANPTNINVDDKGVTDAVISYTIENPVENEALQASVDATWVHLGQAVDGTLTYSVDPYTEEGADARNCNITLSYTGAETVVIPVSQTAPASSSATTIEYVFSEEGYTNAQDLTLAPIAIDANITLTFAQGTNTNNGPKYYNTGQAARLYPKNTMDVVANNGKVIKQITLAFSATNYMGTFVLDGYSGNTWTGSATNVLFTNTANSSHARIQKITVIYE